jgi:hypothetical protein
MNQTVPYGTALLGRRCPRHFVPGYDRTVPPGQAPSGRRALRSPGVWTFTEGHVGRFWPETEGAASRRDDTHRSLARSAWKSVPRKNRAAGYGMIGRG